MDGNEVGTVYQLTETVTSSGVDFSWDLFPQRLKAKRHWHRSIVLDGIIYHVGGQHGNQ